MSMTDRGGVRFFDRMRISREHMEHLEDVLRDGIEGVRLSLGAGVAHGLETVLASEGSATVSPGLAFDAAGRPLVVLEPREVELTWGDANTVHLVALHRLRGEAPVEGVPSLLFDETDIEVRSEAPPYEDGALPFAGIRRADGGATVFLNGDWFLARSNHLHTGSFVTQNGQRRYDGHLIAGGAGGLGLPAFDSGFIALDSGEEIELVHGLQSRDLLVQLQARSDGIVNSQGHGQLYWYELRDEQRITLRRSEDERGGLELRATVWPFAPAEGPLLPLADAGDDVTVDPETSFELDGSRSRARGERELVGYTWTLMS